MNLTRCINGHFYDADKYQTCPHCNAIAEQPPVMETNANILPYVDPIPDSALPTDLPQVPALGENVPTVPLEEQGTDIQKTVGYFEQDMGIEPVVGWLVCTKGAHRGKDFRLVCGRNFIGRSNKMDVVLSGDSSVSREAHAVVIYEPKANIYFIQPGSSKELSYLNGNVVLDSKEIKANDILTVGATELMFIPCCTKSFNWDLNKD